MSSNQVQHPCILFPRPESKLKPQTTVSLKYILVLNVPSTYPYATPRAGRRKATRARPVPRVPRPGAPPADVGSPGDVYIDCTPVAPRLFSAASRRSGPRGPAPATSTSLRTRTLSTPSGSATCRARQAWAWSGAACRRYGGEGVLGDAAASKEEGRALAAKVVGLYLAQEVQGPSASRTKRKRRVRSYSDAEDDEDEGADDDYDDDDDKPQSRNTLRPKALHPAPKRLRTTTATAPSSPPPTPAKPQRDPKAMQRLARELASLTSQRAQLVQHKRALQQQLLLAARSPMDKLRDEYQNSPPTHPSPTWRSPRASQARSFVWTKRVGEGMEPKRIGEEAGDYEPYRRLAAHSRTSPRLLRAVNALKLTKYTVVDNATRTGPEAQMADVIKLEGHSRNINDIYTQTTCTPPVNNIQYAYYCEIQEPYPIYHPGCNYCQEYWRNNSSSIPGLSHIILFNFETTRLNKEDHVEIMEQIHEILCIIIQLHSTSEIKGVLPTAVLYDIAKFTDVLNGQQKGTLGKIMGLFRWPEAPERLGRCKQELSWMVALFKAQVTGPTLSQMGQMKNDAKEQLKGLLPFWRKTLPSPDLIAPHSWLLDGRNLDSSGSFGLLPPCPQIFNGHESELQDVVNILMQDSAHIAILGAGGMGKTSLATVALHNPQVEAKPYWVGEGLKHGKEDNLETPWEPFSARSEVEEFLSLLTDAPHLGLMITLRGAEHPSKVKWTCPFLAPLKPLSNVAARQTFIEVADEGHDDASIQELLETTGNLPLAVSLIASVASSEGCSKALSRWKLESTQMLSDGCSGVAQHPSMLPDGLADADLVQAKLPIPDILGCKATLIQTALAFVGQDQHLKLKLREHFHQILDLWHQFRNLNITDILPQISGNLGNFNTVLHDGLQPEGPDIVQNLRSILFLNDFYNRVHSTYSLHSLQLSEQMLHWKDNQIFGEYLIELFETSQYLPNLDFNSDITLGTQHFTSKDQLEQSRWYHALGVYFWTAKSDLAGALQYFQTAYSLAESTGYPTSVGYNALKTSTDKLGLSAFKGEVTYIWQTIGMLNIFCKNLDTSWLLLVTNKAEIHLVKSEYLESRKLQVTIASSCQTSSYNGILGT
ncbi:hypothetical protein C8J57DRAFT_1484885 [Mycena rebaudengoi]|nr:hypothetical protein C8J57DRAFT_1484885 [Mycena rebaudengoi]